MRLPFFPKRCSPNPMAASAFAMPSVSTRSSLVMNTFTRPKILNVDDDEGCRYAVTRILELNNFAVQEAVTGAEALRLASSEQPDLVLLDVNLPDIDGFEVCKRLKSQPATARIPVLHVTAS